MKYDPKHYEFLLEGELSKKSSSASKQFKTPQPVRFQNSDGVAVCYMFASFVMKLRYSGYHEKIGGDLKESARYLRSELGVDVSKTRGCYSYYEVVPFYEQNHRIDDPNPMMNYVTHKIEMIDNVATYHSDRFNAHVMKQMWLKPEIERFGSTSFLTYPIVNEEMLRHGVEPFVGITPITSPEEDMIRDSIYCGYGDLSNVLEAIDDLMSFRKL